MLKMFLRVPGGEVLIAGVLIAIVSLMIFPLPPAVIDVLLAFNFAASVTVLMVTLYVPDILSLSTFPSLLLFTTLYRLSLNIASTKSILLHADAGHIIEAFGRLVVGGNLVVGLVVFIIITTVQFIVIAKGAERVAEVGARFSLDALPGRQMSIDADLRAGHLTADQARSKRADLSIEAKLHGGMDGAMKFVKGDAIAGLAITAINILGGIAVGMAYHNMSAGEAANRFSVLSIGDAMVSQIPSLLLSVAAGVMTTRVSDDRTPEKTSLGSEIAGQLTSSSRALWYASVLLLGFSAVPGFPSFLFITIAALLGFTAWRLQRRSKGTASAAASTVPSMTRAGGRAESTLILPHPPLFSCPFGVRLASDLGARLSGVRLEQAFEKLRAALEEELGLPFPGIKMWVSSRLPPGEWEVLIHDVPYEQIDDSHFRSHTADSEETATDTNSDTAASESEEQAIAEACAAIIRRHAPLFVGIEETKWILGKLADDYPGLAGELNKVVQLQRMADLFKRLLEEDIPIRNVRAIAESALSWSPKEKDPILLMEYIRGDLSRFLAHRILQGHSSVNAIFLDGDAETLIRQSIKQTPAGNFLALSVEDTRAIVDQVVALAGRIPLEATALITSMDIRRYVRKLIEPELPWLAAYSFQELGSLVPLNQIGYVRAPS